MSNRSLARVHEPTHHADTAPLDPSSRQKPYLNPVLHPSMPAALVPYLSSTTSHDDFTKSQSYARDKMAYSSVINQIDLVQSLILFTSLAAPVWNAGLGSKFGLAQTAGFPYFGNKDGQWTLVSGVWDMASKLDFASTELRTTVVFMAILSTVGTLLSIPQEWYQHFVLEEKHGFNKMTTKTFVTDKIKGKSTLYPD